MQEDTGSIREIDFTSHVMPPTPGVKTSDLTNSTTKLFDFDPRDDFHVYAIEWNATMLTWWVDDVVVKQQPAAPYFSNGWAMDVALSFGLRSPLRGGAPNATGFPTTFYVDWVRTWQRVRTGSAARVLSRRKAPHARCHALIQILTTTVETQTSKKRFV
eukprot:COSAG02_NODE_202_length_29305_cov_20.432377_20_plen_159_part_00